MLKAEMPYMQVNDFQHLAKAPSQHLIVNLPIEEKKLCRTKMLKHMSFLLQINNLALCSTRSLYVV